MVKKERQVYLDILRVLACFLVIFNHTEACKLYMTSDRFLWSMVYIVMVCITRINIPLFLMLSGALLLGKEESLGVVFKKRILRIAVVLCVCSAAVYLVRLQGPFSFKTLVAGFFSMQLEGSYWFLYAYLAMLVMLPYLRRLARDFSRRDFCYFVAFHFLLKTLLPVVSYFSESVLGTPIQFTNYFSLALMTERVIFYPLVGYYLDRVLPIESVRPKQLLWLALSALGGIAVSTAVTYHQGLTVGFAETFTFLFDYLTAIAVFVAVKYLFVQKGFLFQKRKLCGAICTIGTLTFCMYLFDPIWKTLVYEPLRPIMAQFLPVFWYSVLWVALSMTLSGLVGALLRRIPGVKKFL